MNSKVKDSAIPQLEEDNFSEVNPRLCRGTSRGLTFAAVGSDFEAQVESEMSCARSVIPGVRRTVDILRPLCRGAANGFEGAFEALTIQATGFAGGI